MWALPRAGRALPGFSVEGGDRDGDLGGVVVADGEIKAGSGLEVTEVAELEAGGTVSHVGFACLVSFGWALVGPSNGR
jgi:hypothetical protein